MGRGVLVCAGKLGKWMKERESLREKERGSKAESRRVRHNDECGDRESYCKVEIVVDTFMEREKWQERERRCCRRALLRQRPDVGCGEELECGTPQKTLGRRGDETTVNLEKRRKLLLIGTRPVSCVVPLRRACEAQQGPATAEGVLASVSSSQKVANSLVHILVQLDLQLGTELSRRGLSDVRD